VDLQLEALRERADLSLIAFLTAELDLGFTFARTTTIEGDIDQAGVERARELAEQALETVYRFQARIADHEKRLEIQGRACELEKLISAMPKRKVKVAHYPIP
jgi:hypothetical protein